VKRVQVDDITLEGINFRVVSPQNAAGPLPTVIYYHGGCFVSGGFATHDKQLRQLAYESGCRVIAVQYRLAPEQTFPAAHDDAEQGAQIIRRHAERLGWMPRKSPLRAIARGASGSRHRATAESRGAGSPRS
jgi:acetyl esterase